MICWFLQIGSDKCLRGCFCLKQTVAKMTASDRVQHVTPSPSDLSTVLCNVECTFLGCNRTFRNSAARQFHLEKVHKIISKRASAVFTPVWYHCPVKQCPYHVDAATGTAKHFTTKGRLKQHWLKMHAARVLECSGCSQSFSCQRLLSAHRRSCGLDLRCSLCCSSFGSIEALQSHCRRLGHSPHARSLALIRERLVSLARERAEATSSTAVKSEQGLVNTKCTKASDDEQQSISLMCQSPPIEEDCMSSTEDPMNSLSIIMVNGAEEKSPTAQPAFSNVISEQPRKRPSSLLPVGRSRRKFIRSSWPVGQKRFHSDDNESCYCPRSKAVTRCSKSIVSRQSSFGETESSCRSLRVPESTMLSVPVSIRSPVLNNQPHLLAAIALSELAASAIKRFPGVDAATQTESGRVGVSNKSGRRWCGVPTKRRVMQSRQSTQTQTRLTTKSSRGKWRHHCSATGARKKFFKRTPDYCPMHSVESQTKRTSNACSATQVQKLHSLPNGLEDNADTLLFNAEEISYDQRTKVKLKSVNSDRRSHYFVIDSLPSQKSISLGLPEVSLISSESNNSCSTQTSPRARVSVGVVTGTSFHDNITWTFMDEGTPDAQQAALQQGLLDSQGTNKALTKPLQSSSWSHQLPSASGVNEQIDAAAPSEDGATVTKRGKMLLQDAVQNYNSHLTPEVFKYSGEYLLGEKEEVLLEDHNLGDINYGAVLQQTCRVDTSIEASSQLSSVQLSNIETQTEHDILLGLSTSPSNQYHDSCENELEKFGDEDTSTWCSIETQTCEDFSAIEQFLCSTTQTQTSDQVRRELFPELSISHSQTQTMIDDLPSLVHSHTQTYS
ncbi:Zinc finger C2H2-type [Trinorchestia longiramus]|nr:Zinc finger C2H2-type [Trinorchestia longiramus]